MFPKLRNTLAIAHSLQGQLAVDDLLRYGGKSNAVLPGIIPDHSEGLTHINVVGIREQTLRLLDEHSAVEGMLKLLTNNVALSNCTFLEDSDGGHVGQGLHGLQIGLAQASRTVPEQVERTDRRGAQSQGHGVHGEEPLLERAGAKPWPLLPHGVDAGDRDGLAGQETLDTGSASGAELQDLDEAAALMGGRDNLKL